MISLQLSQKLRSIILIVATVTTVILAEKQNNSPSISNDIAIDNNREKQQNVAAKPKSIIDTQAAEAFPSPLDQYTTNDNRAAVLEPRISNFVKDIVDRLHALDADIGKLIFNSTSMYSADDQAIESQLTNSNSSGGQKFTEILDDLDSLQDEIGHMITNATRTRQYNILVRLRPLNNLLYRIRHNLHLMRNSLVAINTVSSIEKLGNSVLDSTLTAFMRPDADLNEEIGDTGNYDINLDNPGTTTRAPPAQQRPSVASQQPDQKVATSAALVAAVSTTTSPATSTTITTTTKQPTSLPVSQSSSTQTERPSRRTTRRPANNRTRTNNRHQRRTTTTTTTTTTTLKPIILYQL